VACPTCMRVVARSVVRLGSAVKSAKGVRRSACSCCGGGVARARSRRRQGRCPTLFSGVRRHGGRVTFGAPALDHASGALGGLGGCSRPRCLGRSSSSCGRGCWVRMGAFSLVRPRRSSADLVRLALAPCLIAGRAAPAVGQVRVGQESRLNTHAQFASCMQQGALLKLTGTLCYVERISAPFASRVTLWVSTALPAQGRQARTCGRR